MVFARITGVVMILFGILIGGAHTGLFTPKPFGLNVVLIGLLVFIAHEVFALVMNYKGEGNKIISVGVPLVFIVIASSYFVSSFLPGFIADHVLLVNAVLMVAEGLYRLH